MLNFCSYFCIGFLKTIPAENLLRKWVFSVKYQPSEAPRHDKTVEEAKEPRGILANKL